MNGKPIEVQACACGGAAERWQQGKAVGLRCAKCGRETGKTELRTEAAFDGLIQQWNSNQPGK